MIFELVKDFADVLEAMPREHPRYRILKLLEEAVRRDVHFIDRHPTTFFQCMWNTCWWYDCPEADEFYEDVGNSDKDQGKSSHELKLYRKLEEWLAQRRNRQKGAWIRALWPPVQPMGGISTQAIANLPQPIVHRMVSAGHVAIHPQGTHIAAVIPEQSFRVWDLTSGTEQLDIPFSKTFRIPGGPWMSFSPTGEYLFCEGFAKLIIDAKTGSVYRQFDVFKVPGNVHLMGGHHAWSPDGRQVALHDGTSAVFIWDIHSGSIEKTAVAAHFEPRKLCFTPDGRSIVVSGANGQICLFDIASGSKQWEIPQQFDTELQRVCFAGRGRFLVGYGSTHVSGKKQMVLRVWDITQRQLHMSIDGDWLNASPPAISSDGRRLAFWSGDGVLRCYDVGAKTLNAEIKIPDRGNRHQPEIYFLPDSRHVACMLAGDLFRWDTADGSLNRVVRLPFSHFRVCGMAGTKYVSFGEIDGTLRLYELGGPSPSETRRRKAESTANFSLVLGGNTLAYVSRIPRLTIRFAPFAPRKRTDGNAARQSSGKRRYPLPIVVMLPDSFSPSAECNISQLATSGDGERLVSLCEGGVGCNESVIIVWSVRDGREVTRILIRGLASLTISRDGSQIAVASFQFNMRTGNGSRHRLVLYDAANGNKMRWSFLNRDSANGMAFSADGSWLFLKDTIFDRARIWRRGWWPWNKLIIKGANIITSDRFAIAEDNRTCVLTKAKTWRSQGNTELWDLEGQICRGQYIGNSDPEHIARTLSQRETPLAFSAGETEIRCGLSGPTIGWFPVGLDDLQTHPSGQAWVGLSGGALGVISLSDADAERQGDSRNA